MYSSLIKEDVDGYLEELQRGLSKGTRDILSVSQAGSEADQQLLSCMPLRIRPDVIYGELDITGEEFEARLRSAKQAGIIVWDERGVGFTHDRQKVSA